MKRYVELNELQKFCREYTEVDAIGQGLLCSTDLLHTVKAIPLDKIKKAREKIDDLDRHFDIDYFSGNKDSVFRCNEVLEILDKLISESEVWQ